MREEHLDQKYIHQKETMYTKQSLNFGEQYYLDKKGESTAKGRHLCKTLGNLQKYVIKSINERVSNAIYH